jgi:hypothetical protein
MKTIRPLAGIFPTAARGLIAGAACLVIAACGGGGAAGGDSGGDSDAGQVRETVDITPDLVDRYVGTWSSVCAGDASLDNPAYERLSYRFTKVSATTIGTEGRHEFFGTDSTCGTNGTLIASFHAVAEYTGQKTLADGKVVDQFKITETTTDGTAGDVRLGILYIQDRSIFPGDATGVDSTTEYPQALDTRIAFTRT